MLAWIVNPFDNLPAEGCRPQRYWLMSEALAAAGHEVVYWTSDFSHARKAPRVMRGESAAPHPGISLRLVPTQPYSENVSFARVRSHRALASDWLALARGEEARPDVVVASLPPLALPLAAMEFARSAGAKFVVDVMDDWPGTFRRLLPRGLGWLGGPLLASARRTAERVYRGADLVTGVCDRYGELVRGKSAAEYRRAYHGIELGPAPAAREGRGGGRLRLVYAGSLGRTYDLATALEAVARNPGWTLDIAGEGEGRAELEASAASPRLAGRVRIHGYLGRRELCALLSECDVGIVPMAPESCVGIPYKLADYAASSLAVASSLGGESAALLERYGAGAAYAPGDADSLVAAVGALAGRLAEARSASRRMAEAEFDAKIIYASYAGWLEKMV